MAVVSTYVTNTRTDLATFLTAWEHMQARIAEYNADGGDAFITAWFGANPSLDITKAQFEAAISSLQAIQTLMGQGHATNLYLVKP